MTPSELARLIEHVEKRWPHAPLPLGAGDVWLEDLAEVPFAEAKAAVTAYARAGERFPPTSGYVLSAVVKAAQQPPPSIDDATRQLARLIASCAPYDARGPEDTATTIAALAERGVHEVVLRFVAEQGVYAVRMMPDADEFALDPNQLADRRDKARHYRDVTVKGWQQDPRPGLALERARAALGGGKDAPALPFRRMELGGGS